MYYYLHNRTKTPQDVFSSRDYSFSLIVGALGGVLFIAGAAVANDESAACASIVVHDVLDTNGAHCAICTEIVSDGALYNTPKPFARSCES